MGHRDIARAWAEHDRSEVRVVTDAATNAWLAYVGSAEALKILDGLPGSTYIASASLTLEQDAPPVRAWLLIPATATAMLLLETIGKVVAVDDRYLALRQGMMGDHRAAAEFYPETPEGLPTPFNHQIEAFSDCISTFQKGLHGFGCWLECGLGKSRWATDLLRALAPPIALILYQKVTIDQWTCCLDNAFPQARCVPLVGPVPMRAEALRALAAEGPGQPPTVLLLNWEVLIKLERELSALAPRLEIIIGDEITKIRNPSSQVSRAARRLGRKVTYRVGMTGTPTAGNPIDLWAQFDFQEPKIFAMTQRQFAGRYCKLGGFTGWEVEGIREDRIPELITKMYSGAYRATKATVTDMPPKSYTQIHVSMGVEQRRHYDNVQQKYGTVFAMPDGGTGRLDVASAIARTTRLMQISAGILPLTEIEVEGEIFGGGTRRIPSAKTTWCVDYAKEIVETTDCKGVLWTMFQPEADRLKEELLAAGIETAVIDGRVSDKRRAEIAKRYLNYNSDLRWLVMNVTAGAYGFDLPCADLMVYHSSTYDKYLRPQSEDRGHRLGRVRPYQVIDVMCNDSVDELIFDAYKKSMVFTDYLVTKGVRAA